MVATHELERMGQIAAETFHSYLPGLPMIAKVAGGAFVALGTALFFGQTYIIYPSYAPSGSRTNVPTPAEHKMPIYEDLTLESPDKLKIRAYLMLQGAEQGKEVMEKEAKRRPTVLFLHANAGNMGHRLPFAHIFYDRLKCNVFMLSYRGYGLSEGKPSEAGIRMDAQLALDYITSHPFLEKTKIIVYGQSIGGAVAADLASRNPDRLAGVILENTFMSLEQMAKASMPVAIPYIAIGLLREKWESYRAIVKFQSNLPCLFLSGEMDEIVPPSQFLELFKLCSSSRKRLRQFKFGTHNDTCVAPGYWQEIRKFMLEEVVGEMPEFNAASNKKQTPRREGTFDERRMEGAEKELEGSIGAGSIAP